MTPEARAALLTFCGFALNDLPHGAVPVAEWPIEIDEPVDLLIEHFNYRFAEGADKQCWRQWCRGYWSDFKRGGWVWDGLRGAVIAVRPVVENA